MAKDSEHKIEHHSADEEIFYARMRAQCEEIEAYRLHVMHSESRKITLEEAAKEWIARYAKSFPSHWRNQ